MEASAAPATSPSSDERLWAGLRDRVDSILQNRDPKIQLSISSCCKMESECGKRLREGSELLMRGFDSVSSSLTHLSSTLNSTRQRVIDLTKYSAPDVLHEESNNADEEVPKPKRHCVSEETRNKDEVGSCDEHDSPVTKTSTESDKVADSSKGDEKIAVAASPSEVLKKNKTLAVMMATKASYLSRELKSIKSEFGFMQERCNLLEEENRRLHDVIDKGDRAEEDDLVRLQLEALLAEKSRLANENACLMRENQCLHELVEYHQLTYDLSASYEQAINGMCLDFGYLDDEHDCDESEVLATPSTSKLGLTSP